MAKRDLPAQEVLLQLLDYEPATGRLIWRPRPEHAFPSRRHARTWNTLHAGREALVNITPNGYKAGAINGKRFYAHRIIWKMTCGYDPVEIDHINGNRIDNRIENLREVTRAVNNRNMGRGARSSRDFGVRPSPTAGKWCAVISVGNWPRHLGTFDTYEAALAARKEAERRLGFHPNHGERHGGIRRAGDEAERGRHS